MIDGVTIAATSTMVVDVNRFRQKLILVNNSDEDIYVAPHSLAVATYGVPLVAAGGAIVDEPDSTGWIYKGPWMAICASGGKILSVTELNRR